MNTRAVDVSVVVPSVGRPARPPSSTPSSAQGRDVALPRKRAWAPPRVRTVEPSAPSGLLMASGAPVSGLTAESCCNPDEQPPCTSGTLGHECDR